jgi:hypothetical protein
MDHKQVKEFRKEPQHAKVHFLTGILSAHLCPAETAYGCFSNTIKQTVVLLHEKNPRKSWVTPPGKPSEAMKALASQQLRTETTRRSWPSYMT